MDRKGSTVSGDVNKLVSRKLPVFKLQGHWLGQFGFELQVRLRISKPQVNVSDQILHVRLMQCSVIRRRCGARLRNWTTIWLATNYRREVVLLPLHCSTIDAAMAVLLCHTIFAAT